MKVGSGDEDRWKVVICFGDSDESRVLSSDGRSVLDLLAGNE